MEAIRRAREQGLAYDVNALLPCSRLAQHNNVWRLDEAFNNR
jgi:hypothetical protein